MRAELLLFCVLGLLGLLPLLGGPRYEAALLAGVLAPGCAALAAARRAGARLELEGELSGQEILWVGLRTGLGHACVVLWVATLHGVFFGFCEPGPGYGLLLLGPGVGSVLGGFWGAGVGVLPGRPRRRLNLALLALAAPVSTAVWGLAEFATSASVYAFDPFVGYFGGPLYDTVSYDLGRLLLFRAGSCATVLALVVAAPAVRVLRTLDGRIRVKVGRGSARWVVAGALALTSLAHAGASPQLGLRTTTRSLAAALPSSHSWGVCRVRHSPRLPTHDAARLARECAAHVEQIRGFFGLEGSGAPIDVFLFENAEEKWRLIGARSTYIAKPWRREIYIQNEVFPHPVLGHELAHVVAGEFGRGPLRIAGPLGGLLPDPGRIEGFAVAAAPAEQGEATELEWSSAMLELGRLPAVRTLFSLGFLGTSAVRAYTTSGAFIAFLHEQYGPEILRRFYGGDPLPELTGRSWQDLDRDFREKLSGLTVPRSVTLLAEEVFSRPAVWGRRCPHAASRSFEAAYAVCGGRPEDLRARLAQALRLDATRVDELAMVPACLANAGDKQAALEETQMLLARADLSQRAKSRVRVARADLLREAGEVGAARSLYLSVREEALARAERRAVDVKLWALGRGAPDQDAVFQLLGVGATTPGEGMRISDLSRWHETSGDPGVPAYLLGLQLADREPRESLPYLLEAAEAQALPSPDLRVEAWRRILIVACRLEDEPLVRRAEAFLLTRAEDGVVRRQAERLADRCRATGL